jgi:hypothetical protein
MDGGTNMLDGIAKDMLEFSKKKLEGDEEYKQPKISMYTIFDIDGVLADCTHRLKYLESKDWKTFYKLVTHDKAIKSGFEIMKAAIKENGKDSIYFLTGRNRSAKTDTINWLSSKIWDECQCDFSHLGVGWWYKHLIMRGKEDYRKAAEYKVDKLSKLALKFDKPYVIYEDDPEIAEAYKNIGQDCVLVDTRMEEPEWI